MACNTIVNKRRQGFKITGVGVTPTIPTAADPCSVGWIAATDIMLFEWAYNDDFDGAGALYVWTRGTTGIEQVYPGSVTTVAYDDLDTVTSGNKVIVSADASSDGVEITNVTDIIFDGDGNTITLNNGTNDYLFSVGTGCQRITIQNFVFAGPDTGTYNAVNEHPGILIDGATPPEHITIKDCTFTGFDSFCIDVVEVGGLNDVEGVTIDKCIFYDCQSDSGAATDQFAIRLQNEAEYTSILNSRFNNVPRMVRATSANTLISGNVVSQCNGGSAAGAPPTDDGVIYISSGTNSGKFTISQNRITHNNNQLFPLNLIGDSSKPQNRMRVINNDILVNTASADGRAQLRIEDNDNFYSSGNTYRTQATSTNATVLVIDSANVLFSGDFIYDGQEGMDVSETSGDEASVKLIGVNFESQTTEITTSGTGSATVNKAETEQVDIFIESPSVKTYTLRRYCKYSGTINDLTHIIGGGTDMTIDIEINGTNVTGLAALTVNTVETTTSATALNTFAEGDTIDLVVSAITAPTDAALSLQITRS